MNEKWSSLEEVAEYLGVTKDTIRNWIKKSDIPAHKVGRQWKFVNAGIFLTQSPVKN